MYRIVISSGEPAGIGPDLCVLQSNKVRKNVQQVVIADPDLLKQRAKELGLPLEVELFTPDMSLQASPKNHLLVLPMSVAEPVVAGQLNAANSKYVIDMIKLATNGCLNNVFDAMLTGPVHKGIINEAGIPFQGHTEFIAEVAGIPRVVMMLASSKLRVALATTHIPLKDVSRTITKALLKDVIVILHNDLVKRFNIPQPKIIVCGLNPHAGEQGHIGREEVDVMQPVLEQLRAEGFHLKGPVPADTVFTPSSLEGADVVLAMYHDQGLTALKSKGLGESTNITLGLPIIRTSVDHGVALDLAGTRLTHSSSLNVAMNFTLSLLKTTNHPFRKS